MYRINNKLINMSDDYNNIGSIGKSICLYFNVLLKIFD